MLQLLFLLEIYLISDESIRGDANSPNQLDKPIWGQTRFTFFLVIIYYEIKKSL